MKWIVIILVIVTVLIFFTSCHSNQINLTYKGEYGATFKNNDSTQIAFVGKKKAYLRAKGIAAFPDGGQPKYLVRDTGIYIIDSNSNELKLLLDITEQSLLSWKISSRIKLIYKDNHVLYRWDVRPISSESKNKEAYDSIDKQYFEAYSIDIKTKKKSVIDTKEFESLYKDYYKKCDLTRLHNILDNIPLADWGLVLQEIKPKSDKKYIKDIVEFKSSSLTRQAIIEQIISKKEPQEIEDILKRMEKFYNSLEGYDKSKQTLHYNETYEHIQKLL